MLRNQFRKHSFCVTDTKLGHFFKESRVLPWKSKETSQKSFVKFTHKNLCEKSPKKTFVKNHRFYPEFRKISPFSRSGSRIGHFLAWFAKAGFHLEAGESFFRRASCALQRGGQRRRKKGLDLWVTTQPQSPPQPTRLTPDEAPLTSESVRAISVVFGQFLTVFGQFLSKTAKIDSKSAPVRGVARYVWPCGGGGLWLEVRSQA